MGAMTQTARCFTPLPKFKLKQGNELLTDHAGLSLVGLALAKFAKVRKVLDAVIPKRSGLSVGEIVTAYMGLLCTGKSDFDAIENHRNDGFFAEALGISGTPAASTLRMQLDAQAEQIIPLTERLSVNLLKGAKAPITPLACGLVPTDIDVPTQDNGRTQKEGVSRTYAGTDGFAPIAAPDGPVGLAGRRCAGAPRGQAPALEDGDPGIDQCEREDRRACAQRDSELWPPLPGVCGVRAFVWPVVHGVDRLRGPSTFDSATAEADTRLVRSNPCGYALLGVGWARN